MSGIVVPIELELTPQSRALIAALGGLVTVAAAPMSVSPTSIEPEKTDITPPAPGTPWPGQGGIYIGTMPARTGIRGYHLIAHPDENDNLKWGPEEEIEGVSHHHDGSANHDGFINAGLSRFPAAHWCSQQTADGHTDYTLPSHAELMLAYVNCPQIFRKDGWYLSSTQYGHYLASCQDFEYGGSLNDGKDFARRARPFRRLFL